MGCLFALFEDDLPSCEVECDRVTAVAASMVVPPGCWPSCPPPSKDNSAVGDGATAYRHRKSGELLKLDPPVGVCVQDLDAPFGNSAYECGGVCQSVEGDTHAQWETCGCVGLYDAQVNYTRTRFPNLVEFGSTKPSGVGNTGQTRSACRIRNQDGTEREVDREHGNPCCVYPPATQEQLDAGITSPDFCRTSGYPNRAPAALALSYTYQMCS
jgi:hypothetical protein